MEFNGTYLEVNSYLFSSDVIPNILNAGNGHTAQYTGVQGEIKKFTEPLFLTVTQNCSTPFISIQELANDTGATAGSQITASAAIQSQAGDRVKSINKMDISDPYGGPYCLP